jgi:hypothetical protein
MQSSTHHQSSNEAPAEPSANKEPDPDSKSLATPINNNTYKELNNGKEDKQEKAKKPDKKQQKLILTLTP